MTRYFITSLFILGFACFGLFAQISQGGAPLDWTDKAPLTPSVKSLKPLSQAKVNVLGSRTLTKGQAFEWGIPRDFVMDFIAEADSIPVPHGVILRKGIRSKGAAMLSLQFSRFELAPGAELFIFNKRRTRFIGSLTKASELPDGTMSTAVLPGEEVVIELFVPTGLKSANVIELSGLVHGVRDIFNFKEQLGTKDYYPGFGAQACHNNVVCPIANGWEEQVSSVALFLNTQGWGCNGVLLNNTAEDGKPYFHIANHCYIPDLNSWTFYWNYESPTCIGDTGQTLQTQVGASLVSSRYEGDFSLLELFQTPPAAYNVYYAGWDATGNQPSEQTVIHHPLYDVKKIAFDQDPASSYTDTIGITMWGCTWDSGIVEFVSSGAPLFDQNQRMIGHMTEGNNQCATVANEITGCAKFSENWNGSQSSTRLKDHLDPLNTGALVLDGFNPNFASVTLPLKVYLQGPYDEGTGLMTDDLRFNGLLPLSEPYSPLGYVFTEGANVQTNSAILATSGNSAIVDWIVVELRDKNDITVVIASKPALLRRNGSIRNADGALLSFQVIPDDYHIAIKHRNHLPVVSSVPLGLSSNTSMIDLTNGAFDTYNGNSSAMVDLGGSWALWAGDVNGDNSLKYTGFSNDRDAVLLVLGGNSPTATFNGYNASDLNMDGVTKYTGIANDRDLILLNIGGNSPTSIRNASFP